MEREGNSSSKEGQASHFEQVKDEHQLSITWVSLAYRFKGGITNQLLDELAKNPAVKVSCLVTRITHELLDWAKKFNVEVVDTKNWIGYSDQGQLVYSLEGLDTDIVLTDGRHFDHRPLQFTKAIKRWKWVHVVDKICEGMEKYMEIKSSLHQLERQSSEHNEQLAVCKEADIIIAVGPKVAEAYRSYLCGKEVIDLTPEIFHSVIDVRPVSDYGDIFYLGVSTDLEEFLKFKQLDIACQAMTLLQDTSYHVVSLEDHGEWFVFRDIVQSSLGVFGENFTATCNLTKRCFTGHLVIQPSRTERFLGTTLAAISADVPVLVNGNSGLGMILKTLPSGGKHVIDSEEPLDWANKIREVREKGARNCAFEAQQLRKEYVDKFSWKGQCDKLVTKMMGMFPEKQGQGNDGATRGKFAYTVLSSAPEETEIVKATMKFEAEHEECVRVLPYSENGRVVIRLYVFSGASGVPDSLKVAAKECFSKVNVTLDWLDLYNDAEKVLDGTPLENPSGESHRLKASQVDEISDFISKNLHQFDKHRNVTSVQASFKVKNSRQTDNPCITIHVLGKGSIPIGESVFQSHLGPYLVDVVNGFWFRTGSPWRPNEAQEQNDVVRLGASIGVDGQEASGTLGAIVKDESTGTLYALSCNHVMKHRELQEDALETAKNHLMQCREEINRINGPFCWDIESVSGLEMLAEKFKELRTIKDKVNNDELHSGGLLKGLEEREAALETVLSRTKIVHPGLNDYLNYLRYNLSEYSKDVYRFADPDNQEQKVEEVEKLVKRQELLEKFIELKTLKQKCQNFKRCPDRTLKEMKNHEDAFTTGFSKKPRVVGSYTKGLQRNVKWTDEKEYFIDAAIAELTEEEVSRLTESESVEVIQTRDRPNGKCFPTKTDRQTTNLCKSGRTTGYTTNGVLVESPVFLKPSFCKEREGGLVDVEKYQYFCQECDQVQTTQSQMESVNELAACERCGKESKAVLRERVYWWKNCLCIAKKGVGLPFSTQGDSGAVVFEKRGPFLEGFGIIFAEHYNGSRTYAIASPLEVALYAVSQEISKDEAPVLRLVSDFKN